nr:ribonuclease HII [Gracilibacillus halophilus]
MDGSIQELKAYVETHSLTEDEKDLLKNDHRKGVQRLYQQYLKKEQKEQQMIERFHAMRTMEMELWRSGKQYVVGVDEVGRGPLAGPVVAAAVVLPETFYLPSINDSKQLSKAKREQFYQYIVSSAIDYQVSFVSPTEIDTINIYQATKKAMKTAILQLPVQPTYILTDAMELEGLPCPSEAIVKGDQKSISIAAASIVAKVTRDTYMEELHAKVPQYQFAKNSGYGTKEHMDAIEQYGISSYHRQSFLRKKNA